MDSHVQSVPGPPLSRSRRVGDLVVVSGQVGHDPSTRELPSTNVAIQTLQALQNVESALAENGAAMSDVIRVGVYLTDTSHFDEMNRIYREVFRAPFPARTTVFVSLLDGFKVEIDAMAVVES